MARDDGGDAGGFRTDVEVGNGVDEVEEVACELDELSGGKAGAGAMGVNVAADGGDWSELAKGIENFDVADVAGVEDVLGRGERDESFRAQEAVGVADDAKGHRRIPNFGLRRRGWVRQGEDS